jgi:hypothetical protein
MALIITPAEIAAATDVAATEVDVQTAQDIIELFSGADLASALPEDRFTAQDLRRLKFAVQWQTAYLATPEGKAALTARPLKRASANGAMLEVDGDGILAPLAKRFLKSCTFLAGSGDFAIHTLRPSLAVVRTEPDPWVRIG